jgi:hypothetical protein
VSADFRKGRIVDLNEVLDLRRGDVGLIPNRFAVFVRDQGHGHTKRPMKIIHTHLLKKRLPEGEPRLPAIP